MRTELTSCALTPSQTVGPYLHLGLVWSDGPDVVPPGTPDAIVITGRVYDGAGTPVPDALVETWQADRDGRFGHPDDPGGTGLAATFRGFGRCPTDQSGAWRIRTVQPGRVPYLDGRLQAPHLAVSVFGRGLLDRVVTRLYFPDDPANDSDPVLDSLPDPTRRPTLIASRTSDGFGFDIRLQGERETVFFDV